MTPSASKICLFDLLEGEDNVVDALNYNSSSGTPDPEIAVCKICTKQVFPHSIRHISLFRHVGEEEASFEDGLAPNVTITFWRCQSCHTDVLLWVKETWWDTLRVLHSAHLGKDGLSQVQSYPERLVLFILSQVCHNQLDYDSSLEGTSPFLPASAEEVGKILWKGGVAIGFYTIIPTGTHLSLSTPECYVLPIVDTVYIRQEYRGQGHCAIILQDIVETYPEQDIAFSNPVSQPLMRALEKYMEKHPEHRDHFWEASYTGAEGYRRNIWLHIKRCRSNRTKRQRQT